MKAKLVRKCSDNTTIGELVGTAGLGGSGFNAFRRNVRFAPILLQKSLANLASVAIELFDVAVDAAQT